MTEPEMHKAAGIPDHVIIGDEDLELAIEGARLVLAYMEGSNGAFGTIITSNMRRKLEEL